MRKKKRKYHGNREREVRLGGPHIYVHFTKEMWDEIQYIAAIHGMTTHTVLARVWLEAFARVPPKITALAYDLDPTSPASLRKRPQVSRRTQDGFVQGAVVEM